MFRFDPFSPEIDADPFPAYRTLRDEYPCFWSEDAGMWVLSRYADVVEALQAWETFSSARGIALGLRPSPERDKEFERFTSFISMDPPKHHKYRQIINKRFTPRALKKIHPDIERIAKKIVDEMLDAGEVEVAPIRRRRPRSPP